MARGHQCCFLLNIYYVHIQDSKDFNEFTSQFKREDLTYSTWHKKRKSIQRYLKAKTSYKNDSAEEELAKFQEYFSYAKFKELSGQVQQQHSYSGCQECCLHHKEVFLLLRSNVKAKCKHNVVARTVRHLQELTPNNLEKKGQVIDLGKQIAAEFDVLASQTGHNVSMSQILKRKVRHPSEVSKLTK